ncbi:MAG TPA: serine hydrolase domain-containing protein [Candidatus Binatia bacterium]|nr:serine hydrolase domain-containing protein [Candidatus Binatia bacterium]
MSGFEKVDKAMEEAVASRVFPGAVLLANKEGQVVYHRAFGHRSLEPEVTPLSLETIFDLSSLTKPLATTLGFLLLVKEKKLRIDDRVTRIFHNFGVHGKTHITFRHLLAHCSGLPGWRPYYKEVLKVERGGRVNFLCSQGAKQHVFELIHREKPDGDPGKAAVYSDLGFMLLGEAIEEISGLTLDRFCHDRVFKPLGARSTSFIDLSLVRTRRLVPVTDMIAPTERCEWRKKIICGEVHDDNAYAMGGVAGHSGLFASAADVNLIVSKVRDAYFGKNPFLPEGLVREALTRDKTAPQSTRTLGWDTPAAVESAAGSRFSKNTVGHLGFTGTSVWLDLDKAVHVVLLSNRVHPSRNNEKIKDFRPVIHDVVMEAMGC